jgi:hypothetical protein
MPVQQKAAAKATARFCVMYCVKYRVSYCARRRHDDVQAAQPPLPQAGPDADAAGVADVLLSAAGVGATASGSVLDLACGWVELLLKSVAYQPLPFS